jgi:hypothetical protein
MGVASSIVWAREGAMGLRVLLPTALISYVRDRLLGEDEENKYATTDLNRKIFSVYPSMFWSIGLSRIAEMDL